MQDSGRETRPRPLVTLTTDFGTRDFYVAALKAVLLRGAPDSALIDVTHDIPRHDILAGAFTLERAIASCSSGAFHLAVVDPGVGTSRKILVARIANQTVVCPDNGLVTWAWRRLKTHRAWNLTWSPATKSNTFHGRDVMAPALAMLAAGRRIEEIATPIDTPVLLDVHPVHPPTDAASIVHIDAFGNATTNLAIESPDALAGCTITVAGHRLGPVRGCYSDVPQGTPLALIGSSGLLEIAVREGSAATQLSFRVGDVIKFEHSTATAYERVRPKAR